jgi:hypothetical protein
MKTRGIFMALLLFSSTSEFAQASSGNVLSAPGGRYVFGQISDHRRDQYLLDTQTGRVWVITCAKRESDKISCEMLALEPVIFNDGSFSPSGIKSNK